MVMQSLPLLRKGESRPKPPGAPRPLVLTNCQWLATESSQLPTAHRSFTLFRHPAEAEKEKMMPLLPEVAVAATLDCMTADYCHLAHQGRIKPPKSRSWRLSE